MVAEQQRPQQQHSPCADVIELRQICRGLVEDRQRMNGSIGRIEANIGELHEKVNGIALLNERDIGNLKAQLAGLIASQQALTAAVEALRQPRAEPKLEPLWGGINKQLASFVAALLALIVVLSDKLIALLGKQ